MRTKEREREAGVNSKNVWYVFVFNQNQDHLRSSEINLSASLDAIGTDRRAKEEQNPITCVSESQDRSSFRFATIFILQRTRAFCGKRMKFE